MSDPLMGMQVSKGVDPLKSAVDRKVKLNDQIQSGEALRNLKANPPVGQGPITQVVGSNG